MVIPKSTENSDPVRNEGKPSSSSKRSNAVHLPSSSRLSHQGSFLQQFSLRTKVMLFAIAVSTLPLLAPIIIQSWQSQPIRETRAGTSSTQDPTTADPPFLLAYLSVAGLSVVLAGGMTLYLTNRVLRPVLRASGSIHKVGQGYLDTRLPVEGRDELAVLSANINWMADQVQSRLERQSTEAQHIQLLKQITLHLAKAQKIDESLQSVVQAIRHGFQFDRVLVYRIDEAGTGQLVAESAAPERMSMMDRAIERPWLPSTVRQPQGHVEAIPDVTEANLPESYLKKLASVSVKASLIAPIVIQDNLLGVLMAHQCLEPYVWHAAEVDTWAQLAIQIGAAWDRVKREDRVAQLVNQTETLTQQQRHHQGLLQAQLTELLQNFEQVASGDLTARARVMRNPEFARDDSKTSPVDSSDVVHVFNATLETLHQILSQVKQSAKQLDAVATSDGRTLSHLDETMNQQAETLMRFRDTTEDLVFSLQAIVPQVRQASTDVHLVLSTTETHAQMLNRTGTSLMRWQEIATETVEQVHQLNYECQSIAKVVPLVNQLILQINILALNASIEAGQGESLRHGSSPVVTQLNELSDRLRSAIQEIERFALNLQHETSIVARGIEHGISLVSQGEPFESVSDQQVEQTYARSNRILEVMQSLVRSTEAQMGAAQTVTDLMQKLLTESQSVSTGTAQVARSHQDIAAIAEQLQRSLKSIKVSD